MAKRSVVKGNPKSDKFIMGHVRETVRLLKSRKKGEGLQNLDMGDVLLCKSLLLEALSACEKYSAYRYEQSPSRGR